MPSCPCSLLPSTTDPPVATYRPACCRAATVPYDSSKPRRKRFRALVDELGVTHDLYSGLKALALEQLAATG